VSLAKNRIAGAEAKTVTQVSSPIRNALAYLIKLAKTVRSICGKVRACFSTGDMSLSVYLFK
jgi:hypothetical protein